MRAPDKEKMPIFPVCLAGGVLAAASLSMVPIAVQGEAEFWIAVIFLAGLSAVFTVWSLRGQALQDLAVLPFAGFAIVVVMQGDYEAVYRSFARAPEAGTQAGFPLAVTALVGISALLSMLAAWRSMSRGSHGVIWAAAAAIGGPRDGGPDRDDVAPGRRDWRIPVGNARRCSGDIDDLLGQSGLRALMVP